ncbi:CopY/TcrY family copper transport repressor [Cytobacillus sp. IB215316]|uniref:CopY/TcrY family copper transport repressor n=1 Tax=Cytobacillus sp. IB215316 TaxID=3097354 RepID=UPI002A0F11DB|nr:CopY/TcrY family copper transport repressor [Cytobacillus sp. IB215316]MDX8362452.1 CopY/TcrY family copper transport repressor [Cytobacillus sp. IB215316]
MLTEDKSKITDAEWEVMRVVWTLNHATSRNISEVLEAKREWAQATTKTLIGRLVKKGMLNTKSDGKRYIYTAAVSENESLKTVRESFFENICSKQVGNELASMISEATLSFDDIDLLEETLAKKKEEAVEEVECNCIPGQCQCKGCGSRAKNANGNY